MKVGIVGCGLTCFSKKDKEIDSILFDGARALFQDSQIQKNDIDAVLVSTNDASKYLSPILAEMIGIRPKIAHSVESLCNSGTNSLVSAYSYICSGLADMVLVCGAERTNSPGQILKWDKSRGQFKHPIFWASMFSKSYKQKYGISDEQLAIVSVKNHKHAKDNPFAISDKTYSIQDVINSKKLTDDLRLLDCSMPCSGGAAILLVSEKIAKKMPDPIWITGIGQKTISGGFTKNPTLTSMVSTEYAVKDALNMSNRTINDIDVAEVHDAFSVCEPMALESLGFADKGRGMNLVQDLHNTDDRKINPRGGLIGAGHPLGATGIAQVIEIVQQLSLKAQRRQVDDPQVGMIHNMSAAATSSTVVILER